MPPALFGKSSPVKYAERVVGGRGQVPSSKTVSSPDEDADFLQNHLSPIPTDVPWRSLVDNDRLKKVEEKKPKDGERECYGPFSSLLTELSGEIYGKNLSILTSDGH